MKTVIWNREDGTCTFAFKFKNGNFAEYVGKAFKTVQGAENAASKAKEYYGEDWSLNNLAYEKYNDKGEKQTLYIHRNGN